VPGQRLDDALGIERPGSGTPRRRLESAQVSNLEQPLLGRERQDPGHVVEGRRKF
jgi:hypothetical protein